MHLRLPFFLTLSGIAALPFIALASWIFVDALYRVIESVNDRGTTVTIRFKADWCVGHSAAGLAVSAS